MKNHLLPDSDSGRRNSLVVLGRQQSLSSLRLFLTPTQAPESNRPMNHPDRVDCAASLSGAYEFDDQTPENYGSGNDPLPNFIENIENYTGTDIPSVQHARSPVALVTTPTSQVPFKPLFLVNSNHDFMPYHQIVDMICELEAHSVPTSDYKTLTISGNDHSFAIWFDWDEIEPVGDAPSKTVGADVIDFLDAHLK